VAKENKSSEKSENSNKFEEIILKLGQIGQIGVKVKTRRERQ